MGTTTKIPRASAERKLGRAAVQLLESWWVYRDQAKLSTVAPIETVARLARLTKATAKRAATKLRLAGLISKAKVYVQGEQKIAIRRVYGSRGRQFHGDAGPSWYVPNAVAEYLAMAPAVATHGGDRRSDAYHAQAGKRALARAQVRDLEPVQIRKTAPILSLAESQARNRQTFFTSDQVSHTSTDLDHKAGKPLFSAHSSLRSSLTENNRYAGCGSAVQPSPGFCGFAAPAIIQNLARLGCVEPGNDLVEQRGPSGGIHVGRQGCSPLESVRRSVQIEFTSRIAREHLPVPPVNQFTVPVAPRVNPNANDIARANQVARAYAGAIESNFQRPNWLFRRRPIADSKHFEMLVAASKEFQRLGIAPAAWAHWSIKHWEETRDQRSYRVQAYRYAPLSWLFSPGRIKARAEMFFDAGGNSQLGGGLVEPELCRKFALAWSAAQRRIINGEDLVTVLDRYFPRGYVQASQELLAACKDAAESLSAEAQAGYYIWGYAYDGIVRERKAA